MRRGLMTPCPQCRHGVEDGKEACPHCGHPLTLRRGAIKEPPQIFRDLHRFLWVAIVFVLLLVPLGLLLAPD